MLDPRLLAQLTGGAEECSPGSMFGDSRNERAGRRKEIQKHEGPARVGISPEKPHPWFGGEHWGDLLSLPNPTSPGCRRNTCDNLCAPSF